MAMDGLDVSTFQGAIDWDRIPSNYRWVAIRALRGTVIDPHFIANWDGSQRRRLTYRLAYAYLLPGDARQQAESLLSFLGDLERGEGIMLDLEDSHVAQQEAVTWLRAIEEYTKRPAVIYLGGTLLSKAKRLSIVGDRPLVWPVYRDEAYARETLHGRTWDAWQYTDKGSIPGIVGPVDLDRIDNLAAFDRACGMEGPLRYPYAYGGALLSWDQLLTRATVNRLHPEFRRRVKAIMDAAAADGVALGIGTGWRVQPDPPPAGFAKPGNSNHEGFPVGPDSVGAVAADMVPEQAWPWMEANCHRFGLRTFKQVNGEPWHIQPVEIPASRNWRTQPWQLPVIVLPGDVPAPTPHPSPVPHPDLKDEMALIRKDGKNAVWATNGVHRRHVTLNESMGPARAVFGDEIVVSGEVDLTDAFGRVVGDDPGDV